MFSLQRSQYLTTTVGRAYAQRGDHVMSTAFDRIYAATNTRTQVELAELLDIRQSSISDAKRRDSIPDSWLVTLLKKAGLNPEWILTGQGAKFLVPAHIPQEKRGA